ncbi:MAG: AAA family ATPase, partial [Desulfovibrio sp.]|nr:AAA family ATPase [Desulfovibrio sp.]
TLTDSERKQFDSVSISMDDAIAQDSLLCLSEYLYRQQSVKPIILLDEYDSPLQEAWLNRYWDKLLEFLRGFFNSTFKTNFSLGRALITGITRVSKESIFSDMNNLKVVSITSDFYADCFGFTEQEVFLAMDEYGLTEKNKVKEWYDGFIFGKQKEIYNPWSIINYLSEKKFSTYWADSSSNAFVGELIANGNDIVKEETEILLHGKSVITKLDEQVIFHELYTKEGAIWSLLMAAGYVKPLSFNYETGMYEIILTNLESKKILEKRISEWFGNVHVSKNKFISALLQNNLDEMNNWMSDIAKNVFSYFDTKKQKYEKQESFYHAFVLGLIVDLQQYEITSNGDSGYGRYDIMLIPKNPMDHSIVIEFKTHNSKKEKNLNVTCSNALKQIYEKEYITKLKNNGIILENIYVYGFAFSGKHVQILGGNYTDIDWDSFLD